SGFFFDFWRWLTRLTASSSMFLSGSHKAITSTAATWISRNRSLLPYQPVPISPTRYVFSDWKSSKPLAPKEVRASNAVEPFKKWRRLMLETFMEGLLGLWINVFSYFVK